VLFFLADMAIMEDAINSYISYLKKRSRKPDDDRIPINTPYLRAHERTIKVLQDTPREIGMMPKNMSFSPGSERN
jgi:hypothetical protein